MSCVRWASTQSVSCSMVLGPCDAGAFAMAELPVSSRRYFHSAVDEILVVQLGVRIGERALGPPERHAHLGEADADRLGVEHLHAGRLGEVVGVDHVADQ